MYMYAPLPLARVAPYSRKDCFSRACYSRSCKQNLFQTHEPEKASNSMINMSTVFCWSYKIYKIWEALVSQVQYNLPIMPLRPGDETAIPISNASG